MISLHSRATGALLGLATGDGSQGQRNCGNRGAVGVISHGYILAGSGGFPDRHYPPASVTH